MDFEEYKMWTQLTISVKVCIKRLDHICFEKSSSTFWQIGCCAHRTGRSCQKYDKDFFKFYGLLKNWTKYHHQNQYLIWRDLNFMNQPCQGDLTLTWITTQKNFWRILSRKNCFKVTARRALWRNLTILFKNCNVFFFPF